ncbi:MAG TPA: transposase [Desulfobaccales bacterium]|nr:transposase [Desulfobaccales bacterium]
MTANRVGIDFSQNWFDLVIAGVDGQLISPVKRFDHNRLGAEQAQAFLRSICSAAPAEQIWIGGEATGLLWWPLYQAWAHDPALAALHAQFFLLNPAPVKAFRKSTSQKDKTDRRDARLIVRYLGVPDQELAPWYADQEIWPLRFLTRYRFRLAHLLGSLKLQAQQVIWINHSAYLQTKPFHDPLSKVSLELLRRHPNLEELADWSLEQLEAEIEACCPRGHLPNLAENARQLQQAARCSYPLDAANRAAIQFLLEQSAQLLESLEARLRKIDVYLAQQVEADPEIANLQAIPGIGPVFAAGMAAELRPTQRFLQAPLYDPLTGVYRERTLADAQAAVGKYAGLWWPRHDSGQFQAEERHMPKACNPYLRYYLVEAADHVRGRVAEFGTYYQRKYAEVNQHQHRRALVLTARKLLRLVFVLLHNHETYQPRRQAQS